MITLILVAIFGTFPAGSGTLAQADCRGPGGVPSISELKSVHADLLAAVKTLVIQQKVVELRKPLPKEDEKIRADLTQMATAAHAQAMARPNLTAAQREQVDAHLGDQLAAIEATLTVVRLNEAVALEQAVFVDLVNGNARYDNRDLRALDRLSRDNGVDRQNALTLDKTGTTILTRARRVELMPQADKLAVVTANPVFSLEEQAYRLGILPACLFANGVDLQVTELVPTVPDELRLVGRRDGAVFFAATLRADIGYRFSALTIYGDDGKPSEEFTAADFRKTGETLVPFRTSYTVNGGDVDACLIERQEVRSAEVNAALPDRAFSTPAEYHVQKIGVAELE
jgi:hypothetical protein